MDLPPPAPGPRRLRAALVLGLQLLALWPVAAVEVHTSKEVEAVNGTNVRLKCTFSSFSPVGKRLTVTWNFRPQGMNAAESVFYYYEEPYPPTSGRFKERVTWDGNIGRNDASIVVWNLNANDNGTFTCQVKNPPDVDGMIGEIQLWVVQQVHFSEIHILLLAIGSACALMILLVIVVVVCRHYQNRRQEKSAEMVNVELPEKEKLKHAEEKEAVPLDD
ncbi:myelin protein zero-like protein 2 [Carettochelys insculpta]|uniref:myelin protein zero-like protein 2 n=1 Tax=Carettochelys insculpta TaxID=44489 RepID=UPI003EB80D3F